MRSLVVALLLLAAPASAQVTQGVTIYNGSSRLGLVGKLKFSSGICAKTAANTVTCTVSGADLGNWTLSGNNGTTSGSPTTLRSVHQFTDSAYGAPDGTAGAPSHSFSEHATSGMFYDHANSRVAFAVGGTELLRMNGSFVSTTIDFFSGVGVYSNSGTFDTGGSEAVIGGTNASGVALGKAAGDVRIVGTLRNSLAGNQTTTVGGAGGASALPATPLGYLTVKLNDGSSVKVPYYSP